MELTGGVRIVRKSDCTLCLPRLQLVVEGDRNRLEVQLFVKTIRALWVREDQLLEPSHDVLKHIGVAR